MDLKLFYKFVKAVEANYCIEFDDYMLMKLEEMKESPVNNIGNTVKMFADEKIGVELLKDIPKKEVYIAYCNYCKELGLRAELEQTFHKKMIAEGYRSLRRKYKDENGEWKNGKANYLNITIKEN